MNYFSVKTIDFNAMKSTLINTYIFMHLKK